MRRRDTDLSPVPTEKALGKTEKVSVEVKV